MDGLKSIIPYKELHQKFIEHQQKVLKELQDNAPRILILGDTGVGKSTLINEIFQLGGENAAPVAHVLPETQIFQEYFPGDKPVRLVDSKGIENLTVRSQLEDITNYIKSSQKKDLLERVHIVWYMVGTRWQDSDAVLCKSILKDIPIVFIISKCDTRTGEQIKQFKTVINEAFPDNNGIFCVGYPQKEDAIAPETCPNGHDELIVSNKKKTWKCNECEVKGNFGRKPQFGYVDVVRSTITILPKVTKNSFRAAQMIDMKTKDAIAFSIVTTAATSCGAIAASPLPFSDWPALMLFQGGMIASLAANYGVDVMDIKTLATWSTSQISAVGVGYGVAALIKFVPGIGTIVGGAINTAIAASVTTTIGTVVANLFRRFVINHSADFLENLNDEELKEPLTGEVKDN